MTQKLLKRILIPLDFSQGSELALRRAFLLPLNKTGEIHAIHVVRTSLSEKDRAKALAEAGKALQLVDLPQHTSRVRMATNVLRGEPFVEIIRYARKIEADLIILGRHGHRAVRDMFIGSTAERVIHKGDTPVLIVNTNPTDAYRRPLIATDLEDVAPRVFELAFRVLSQGRSKIRVVHALHIPFEGLVTPASAIQEPSEYRRHFEQKAKAKLSKLLARFGAERIQWTTRILPGDPRSIIPAEARRSRSDLIIMGTHARSGLAHVLIGSVADWVINTAPCDILVGRPARFTFELP
jgi:nucleotide-binding universal stress UspA family protein